MKIEIKVPAVGESITEATIGSWTKKNGDFVKRNEIVLLLETDKASVEVVAENDGVLHILAEAGQVVKIGALIATIDTDAAPSTSPTTSPSTADAANSGGAKRAGPPPLPGVSATQPGKLTPPPPLSPAVQKMVLDRQVDVGGLQGTGKDGRLTKGDILSASGNVVSDATTLAKANSAKPSLSTPSSNTHTLSASTNFADDKYIVPMTTIRKKIAERLVEAQSTAAILTTFNEIDMTRVIELRQKYKDKFKEKHGVNLGFMSFFVKAAIEALKAFPAVNAYISGTNIEYHNYFNIGVAVSTEKGLMVPVIKNAHFLSMAQIEMAIRDYAQKARDGKISIDDLSGGTFTVTNGGVFGSLMSTPILNPPQSAILGMHKLEDRAVVIDKKIEVRTMMYVALSYDHRIIDGKDSVGFLVKIKEGVEDPERLLIEV